jgi:cytochrome c biogenesis protein CcmG, thiol:disulfide interchange protein DsbE
MRPNDDLVLPVAPTADLDGRVGIDWGVYGVPETFVVDAEGRIAFKQIGPVTSEILDQTILPLVRKLRQKGLRNP